MNATLSVCHQVLEPEEQLFPRKVNRMWPVAGVRVNGFSSALLEIRVAQINALLDETKRRQCWSGTRVYSST